MLSRDQKYELEEGVKSLMSRFGIRGHIVLILDDDKLVPIGELSLASLLPILLKLATERLH